MGEQQPEVIVVEQQPEVIVVEQPAIVLILQLLLESIMLTRIISDARMAIQCTSISLIHILNKQESHAILVRGHSYQKKDFAIVTCASRIYAMIASKACNQHGGTDS